MKKTYTEQQRLAAVLDALVVQATPSFAEVCERHGVDPTTLRLWLKAKKGAFKAREVAARSESLISTTVIRRALKKYKNLTTEQASKITGFSLQIVRRVALIDNLRLSTVQKRKRGATSLTEEQAGLKKFLDDNPDKKHVDYGRLMGWESRKTNFMLRQISIVEARKRNRK